MYLYFGVSVLSILIAGVFYRKKYSLELSFLILTVFFAIRYNYGNDYYEYLRHFELSNVGNLNDALEFERFEDGWVILCRLFNPIGFFGIVIVLTIFENIVLYYMFRKYIPPKWHWLALFCYLFNTDLCLTGMSMMRQFLAMCICLISFDFLTRKRIVIAFLLILLAAQFHTSAYICVIALFLYLMKNYAMSITFSISLLISLVLLGFLAVNMFGGFISDFIQGSLFNIYESKLEDVNYEGKIGVTTFLNYYLIAVILLLQRKQDEPNKMFVLIYIAYLVIATFRPIAPLINRVGFYFYLLFPICMANAASKQKGNIQTITIYLLILLNIYGYFSFVGGSGWGSTFFNYQTIFSANHWM